jgi:fumarate hydratase class I
VKELQIPISKQAVESLHVGDEVSLVGTLVTARDAAHKVLVEDKPDFIRPYLKDSVIYHCGPVMIKQNEIWRAIAAGPTTSIREEPFEADVIREYGVRGIIGKGGMGPKTSAALKECGAVYLHAVGGAAALIADSIEEVQGVFMLEELGVPEAFWILGVNGLKATVTMDAHGQSLHEEVMKSSRIVRDRLIAAR